MENQTQTPAPTQAPKKEAVAQRAAVNGLALVGFLVLVFFGITLAIYSARYVPMAVSQLASAGSALTGKSGSSSPATLSVVSGGSATDPSTGTATLPFTDGNATTMSGTSGLMPITGAATQSAPVNTSSSNHVSTHASLYGLPDLKVSTLVTGYLANGSNQSFIPSSTVPAGARAAVQFTVSNTGTNATGNWGFIAELPETNGYVFTSPIESNMNPGDHTLFTLGFDQVTIAPGPQPVTVQVDPNNQIQESNEGNNSASSAFEVAP